ncbi:hypothetical protein CYMTET_39751 [Cymbomonas tetramitiformis]|uniref:Uncharacterized protein n=1 Tax=Cymbomonas tetramitiformis TaxID=36881 RepID=A0AAE0CAW0_9CHLO|nr:hypothetical protein CYMTET_39751 [Cymbomonas tetramitiformis]
MTGGATHDGQDELAEEANKERIDRAEQLDGLRLQVNALEDVLSRRWQERKGSVDTHNLAGAVMAVEASMSSGKALGPAVSALAGQCEGDVLVHAAIDSLPPSVREHGVMSKAQLLESLEEVKPAARELVLIPSGSSAGPITMVVARVAAALRVREDAGSGGSIESTLARVQGLIAADEVVAAAAELEDACKGTAAAPIVGEWVKAARERALVDQTLSVLQAQAITLTAAYTSQ